MRMLHRARRAAADIAAQGHVGVAWERLWEIEPLLFDRELVDVAEEAVEEVSGGTHRLASGPLHDAAEMVRAGVPTAMIFVRSIGGISHNAAEDSTEADIRLSVLAFDLLVRRTIELKARTDSRAGHGAGRR